MLYTLAVILLIAWLLGLVGTYTIGAFSPRAARHRDRAVPGRPAERAPDRRLALLDAVVSWQSPDRRLPIVLPLTHCGDGVFGVSGACIWYSCGGSTPSKYRTK